MIGSFQTPGATGPRRSSPAIALAVGVVIAYLPVWHAGFIWDDDRHITRPELVSLAGLFKIWFQLGATQQYYPFVHSTFWLEHKLWGDAPLGYHLVNVFLHVCSALLLVRVLQRLKIPGAWLAAAIFALHPVEVESVAWVSELKNTLSDIFYLGATLVYLGFDETRDRRKYAAALGLFTLALLSKTVTASLPGALLVIFWWQRGKLSWRRDALPLVPFFILGLAAGLLTAWVEKTYIHAEGAAYNFSLLERCLIAGRVIWFYLGNLFWPVDLIFINPRWIVSTAVAWQWFFPAAAVLLVAMLAWISRRWRGPLAALLFFIGTLVPALGFVNVYPFRYSLVADHFQYLAGLGPITLVAAGLALLAARWPKPIISATFLIVLTLGVLTFHQCGQYHDAETLWRATLARDPASVIARNNLSQVLMDTGRVDEGMALCQSVLTDHPSEFTAHFNLGSGFLQKGKLDDAITNFQSALQLQPASAGASFNLGRAYLKKGDMNDAVRYLENAVALQPDYADAFCNLGYALVRQGHLPEAVAAYNKALEQNPRYALAHNDLGGILLRMGKTEDAMDHFEAAAEIDPGFAEAHYNLAEGFMVLNRPDDAVIQYENALKINPALAEAEFKIGMIDTRRGRAAEAISHFENALKIQPAGGNNPAVLQTLAAAYAADGRFEDAVKTIDHALPLASGNAALTDSLKKQKAAYQSKKIN